MREILSKIVTVSWHSWREATLGVGLVVDQVDGLYGLYIFLGSVGILLGWRR